MTWNGMERVRGLLLLEMAVRSAFLLLSKLSEVVNVCRRFGHVFMMDTGSSAGEISGHSKVWRFQCVDRKEILIFQCSPPMLSPFVEKDLSVRPVQEMIR